MTARKARRKFTAEFKHVAACLVIDQGYSHAEACRSLDLTSTALRSWVKQLREERDGFTPKSKAMTPEQQRIQELINMEEHEKLRMVRDAGLLEDT